MKLFQFAISARSGGNRSREHTILRSECSATHEEVHGGYKRNGSQTRYLKTDQLSKVSVVLLQC